MADRMRAQAMDYEYFKLNTMKMAQLLRQLQTRRMKLPRSPKFLGEELGARPKDLSCYVEGKAIYQKIAATTLFKKGMERIKLGIKKSYTLALMCAEKDPMTCHRTILIFRNLRGQSVDIQHIIADHIIEMQADLEKRLMVQLKLHPDMFKDTDPNALIERAYDVQGDRIAYTEAAENLPDPRYLLNFSIAPKNSRTFTTLMVSFGKCFLFFVTMKSA